MGKAISAPSSFQEAFTLEGYHKYIGFKHTPLGRGSVKIYDVLI
jgi:hypothetical protein